MSLVVDTVRLTYPDGDRELVALDDVSLAVAPGEMVAVTGPSGSGKSSLLAVAGGLVSPDSGRVLVAGIDLSPLSGARRDAVRRTHIGYVFQQSNLLASLTARDQLLLVGSLDGRSSRADRGAVARRADELLSRVGLTDRASRRPSQLSGGERQRVGIARALMGTPGVLLVDEPTSALDHDAGAAVMTLLREMTVENAVATVVGTHDLQFLPLADRVVSLHDGAVADPVAFDPRASLGQVSVRDTARAC
jgi:putative ABC transport system ATP-binding protein